jgi:hypothetical protein
LYFLSLSIDWDFTFLSLVVRCHPELQDCWTTSHTYVHLERVRVKMGRKEAIADASKEDERK